jgi:hypothetical protein
MRIRRLGGRRCVGRSAGRGHDHPAAKSRRYGGESSPFGNRSQLHKVTSKPQHCRPDWRTGVFDSRSVTLRHRRTRARSSRGYGSAFYGLGNALGGVPAAGAIIPRLQSLSLTGPVEQCKEMGLASARAVGGQVSLNLAVVPGTWASRPCHLRGPQIWWWR